jgi:putative peptidoglycan lipid II flippase
MSRHNVLRSTVLISACTGLSRVLGFAREMFMAHYFGTSLAKSAFDVAFKVPNLFRRLFGEGALSAAFIPVFAQTVEEEGAPAANQLLNRMASLLAAILSLVVLVGIVAIAAAMAFLPLGERATAVLPLLQIMLPYAVLICVAALCMAALNALHHFTLPALTPLLLNVVWIAALVIVCPRMGASPDARIRALAWAITIAGVVQLAVQIPALGRFGIWLRPSLDWRSPRVRSVLTLMLPAALGMGVVQINVLADGLMALWVGKWAPAALTYAERLVYLPLGLMGTALGTVLLPTFARQAAAGRHSEMARTLEASIQNLMVIVIPLAAGMTVLARPIVDLTFKGGEFGAESATYTARALMFYAPGLIPFSLYKLLVPAFYATKDTRTPVRIGAAMVALNICLNLTFILTWPEGWGHAGLACATSLSSLVNCLLLGRVLSRRITGMRWGETAGILASSLTAAAVMAGCVAAAQPVAVAALARLELAPKVQHLGVLALLGGLGLAVYAAGAWLLCREALIRALTARRAAKAAE